MDVQGRGRWARSGQDIQGDWAPSADDKAAPTPGNREVQTGSLSGRNSGTVSCRPEEMTRTAHTLRCYRV